MSRPAAASLRPAYLAAAEDLRDNPGQWQAYESNGNCVMLAGPGSGKTRTLTIKLARMLSEDVRAPRGVACITYNLECAAELRRRLDGLGIQESGRVYLGTIHSLCLKHIVLPFGRVGGLDLPAQVSVAAPAMQDRVFEQAFGTVFGPNANPYGWRTDSDRYRRTHLDRTAAAWQRDHAEMAALIEDYERGLRSRGLIDFDDMVLLGLRLIESHEWVRKILRAGFPILAVDECQDLGVPLHRMVLSLGFSAGVRILAVGDEDQSIYGFTGARPESLAQLSKMDGVQAIRLPFNYRSGKTIVDASLVALGENRGYTAKSKHQSTIDFYPCPNGLEQQADLICTKLIPEALRRRRGRKLSDVAVLYLDKNDGHVIEAAAKQADLPVRTWLAEFGTACLNDTLQREKTLSEEVEAMKQLVAAVREGGKLDALTVAGFGHQGGAPDHLNLITLHSAKGQEFDVVLMMGMDQGKIPSWSAKTAEQKREPRRLF